MEYVGRLERSRFLPLDSDENPVCAGMSALPFLSCESGRCCVDPDLGTVESTNYPFEHASLSKLAQVTNAGDSARACFRGARFLHQVVPPREHVRCSGEPLCDPLPDALKQQQSAPGFFDW